tara:strand:+ start:68572 stop:69990 length:1419 start_codon:yes stop_codon:yes gene_type:complete
MKFAVSLLVGQLLVFNLASAEVRSAELSFLPHSASFLAQWKGAIAQEDSAQGHRSLIERFDLAAKTALKAKPMAPYIEYNYTRPLWQLGWKIKFWHGFCDDRSRSSLDPKIHQMVMAQDAIDCNGIEFSQGELKELFTAFSDHSAPSVYLGGVTEERLDPRAREITGFDDVHPHKMHEFIFNQLETDRGFIVEEKADASVNNVAAFKAESESFNLSLKQILDQGYVLRIPLMQVTASSEASAFKHLQHIQSEVRKVTLQEAPRYQAIEEKIQAGEDYDEDYLAQRTQKIIEEREASKIALRQYIKSHKRELRKVARRHTRVQSKERALINAALKQNNAMEFYYEFMRFVGVKFFREKQWKLNGDIKFVAFNTDVYVRDNAPFNHPEDPTKYIRIIPMKYFIIYQGDEVMESSWRTPAKKRPDQLWYSEPTDFRVLEMQALRARVLGEEMDPFRLALSDLVHLIKTCEPINHN